MDTSRFPEFPAFDSVWHRVAVYPQRCRSRLWYHSRQCALPCRRCYGQWGNRVRCVRHHEEVAEHLSMRQHTAIHGAVVNDASMNATWQVVSAAMSTCTATTGVKKMRILCGKSTTPPPTQCWNPVQHIGGILKIMCFFGFWYFCIFVKTIWTFFKISGRGRGGWGTLRFLMILNNSYFAWQLPCKVRIVKNR